jgi:hypothetical protein
MMFAKGNDLIPVPKYQESTEFLSAREINKKNLSNNEGHTPENSKQFTFTAMFKNNSFV